MGIEEGIGGEGSKKSTRRDMLRTHQEVITPEKVDAVVEKVGTNAKDVAKELEIATQSARNKLREKQLRDEAKEKIDPDDII